MASVAYLGMMELLVLLGSTFNSPTHDLVSLLRAEDYFKSRNLAVEAPGLVKLVTRPVSTGNAARPNTIGTVAVACFAANVAGVPAVQITSTLSRTSARASSGSRAGSPSAHRASILMFRPST